MMIWDDDDDDDNDDMRWWYGMMIWDDDNDDMIWYDDTGRYDTIPCIISGMKLRILHYIIAHMKHQSKLHDNILTDTSKPAAH